MCVDLGVTPVLYWGEESALVKIYSLTEPLFNALETDEIAY